MKYDVGGGGVGVRMCQSTDVIFFNPDPTYSYGVTTLNRLISVGNTNSRRKR